LIGAHASNQRLSKTHIAATLRAQRNRAMPKSTRLIVAVGKISNVGEVIHKAIVITFGHQFVTKQESKIRLIAVASYQLRGFDTCRFARIAEVGSEFTGQRTLAQKVATSSRGSKPSGFLRPRNRGAARS